MCLLHVHSMLLIDLEGLVDVVESDCFCSQERR